MKPKQLKALLKPALTQEELKDSWEAPEAFKFSKDKVSLITVSVIKEGEVYKWHTSVRIQNEVKKNIKRASLLTAAERLRIKMILENELSGVGQEAGREEFDSAIAMHLCKKLTPEELGILAMPHVAGH